MVGIPPPIRCSGVYFDFETSGDLLIFLGGITRRQGLEMMQRPKITNRPGNQRGERDYHNNHSSG